MAIEEIFLVRVGLIDGLIDRSPCSRAAWDRDGWPQVVRAVSLTAHGAVDSDKFCGLEKALVCKSSGIRSELSVIVVAGNARLWEQICVD